MKGIKTILYVIVVIIIVIGIIVTSNILINNKKSNNKVNNDSSTELNTEETTNEINEENIVQVIEEKYEKEEGESIITSELDIELTDISGNETKYTFKYKDETFTAIYTPENWKIIDSYKIKNRKDMTIICKALIEAHPIHGKDYLSYREPEDMAYEWIQHNIAYEMLPEDHRFKENTKDVDLNPEDQGKNVIEMYEEKTGEKFSINSFKELL